MDHHDKKDNDKLPLFWSIYKKNIKLQGQDNEKKIFGAIYNSVQGWRGVFLLQERQKMLLDKAVHFSVKQGSFSAFSMWTFSAFFT